MGAQEYSAPLWQGHTENVSPATVPVSKGNDTLFVRLVQACSSGAEGWSQFYPSSDCQVLGGH